jgi:hypothetical protein
MSPACDVKTMVHPRLLELREARGALRTRCAMQRHAVARHAEGVRRLCDGADQVLAGLAWLRRNPLVVGAAALALVLCKPARLWRWGRRSLFVWQGWRALRQKLLRL